MTSMNFFDLIDIFEQIRTLMKEMIAYFEAPNLKEQLKQIIAKITLNKKIKPKLDFPSFLFIQ